MNPRIVGWSFVAIQIALLGAIVLLPGANHWTNPPVLSTAAHAASWVGLAVVVAGSLGLGSALTATPAPKAHAGLRTGGLYRFTRHPIYSGVLLFVVGSVVASGSYSKSALGVLTAVFFNVKARWEESRLRDVYPRYSAYAARTPRFVPRLLPRSTRRLGGGGGQR